MPWTTNQPDSADFIVQNFQDGRYLQIDGTYHWSTKSVNRFPTWEAADAAKGALDRVVIHWDEEEDTADFFAPPPEQRTLFQEDVCRPGWVEALPEPPAAPLYTPAPKGWESI